MNKFVVYKITNIINNKFYIGSTKYFITRKTHHIYTLNKKIHRNIYLQRSWDKYGEINFKFEDIYSNMDEKNNKLTKGLLHEKSSNTNTSDPFFCMIFFNI